MALTKVSRGLLSTGIVDNSNATAITLNADESATFSGALTANGTVNVHTGSAGTVSPSTQADDLVIENSAEGGMTIITPDNQSARIRFTSPSTNNDVGGATIFYRQNINKMLVGTAVSGGVLSLASGAGNETMVLNGSGFVGIGTNSPTHLLQISGGTSDGRMSFTNNARGNGQGDGMWVGVDNTQSYLLSRGAYPLNFYTNATVRATIDSGGNLLVGRTSVGGTGNGHSIRGGDSAIFSRDSSGESCIIARNNTPGPALRFNSNGANIGGIGTHSTGGVELYMGNGSNIGFRFEQTGADRIEPCVGLGQSGRNNAIDLGIDGNRWRVVYCASVNESSDRTLKQDIEELSDAEQRVAVAAKSLLKKYRFISDVEQDDDRYSFGIIAQDLQAAFAAQGLDAANYKMWNESTFTDEATGEEKTQQSIVYSQLLAFIISAI